LNGEKPANTDPIRLEALPGSRWKYSGGGYMVMQQLLIDVSYRPFPALLHDTVLAPIGMTHSMVLPQQCIATVAVLSGPPMPLPTPGLETKGDVQIAPDNASPQRMEDHRARFGAQGVIRH
jgi:CubicO group peptidase (beta-lactamase class C family)